MGQPHQTAGARALDLNVFSQGWLSVKAAAGRVTEKGRTVLELMGERPAPSGRSREGRMRPNRGVAVASARREGKSDAGNAASAVAMNVLASSSVNPFRGGSFFSFSLAPPPASFNHRSGNQCGSRLCHKPLFVICNCAYGNKQ